MEVFGTNETQRHIRIYAFPCHLICYHVHMHRLVGRDSIVPPLPLPPLNCTVFMRRGAACIRFATGKDWLTEYLCHFILERVSQPRWLCLVYCALPCEKQLLAGREAGTTPTGTTDGCRERGVRCCWRQRLFHAGRAGHCVFRGFHCDWRRRLWHARRAGPCVLRGIRCSWRHRRRHGHFAGLWELRNRPL